MSLLILFFRISALQQHFIWKGRKLISNLAKSPIIIINDQVIFTQSDMHVSNFSVDECGKTVLLDFGAIGRLPLSTPWDQAETAACRVANILRWPMGTQWPASLIVYGWHPTQNSVQQLVLEMGVKLMFIIGLDKDGLPKPKSFPNHV